RPNGQGNSEWNNCADPGPSDGSSLYFLSFRLFTSPVYFQGIGREKAGIDQISHILPCNFWDSGSQGASVSIPQNRRSQPVGAGSRDAAHEPQKGPRSFGHLGDRPQCIPSLSFRFGESRIEAARWLIPRTKRGLSRKRSLQVNRPKGKGDPGQ